MIFIFILNKPKGVILHWDVHNYWSVGVPIVSWCVSSLCCSTQTVILWYFLCILLLIPLKSMKKYLKKRWKECNGSGNHPSRTRTSFIR